MNIFGRVFGGLLVLISLGWLATIVGIRPGGFNNQINSSQGTTTNSLTGQANQPVGTVPADKSKASTFDAKGAEVKAVPNSATSPKTEVEKDPRSATPPSDKAVSQTAPVAPTPTASQSAPAAPVSAGW